MRTRVKLYKYMIANIFSFIVSHDLRILNLKNKYIKSDNERNLYQSGLFSILNNPSQILHHFRQNIAECVNGASSIRPH